MSSRVHEDLIDDLKSSFGLGSSGRLQTKKNKKKKKKKERDKAEEDIEEQRRMLRRRWFKRFSEIP